MFLRLTAYGRKIILKPFELTDFAFVSAICLLKYISSFEYKACYLYYFILKLN